MAVKRSPGPPPELPVECSDAEHAALRAWHAGTASPDQMRRAIDWIIVKAAGTYELSFRPGADGERDTAFAEGRRFVGLQIVKQLNTFRTTAPKGAKTRR